MKGTSFSNISNLRGTTNVPSWQRDQRQRTAVSAVHSKKKMTERPSWNEGSENPHKLSHAELLQRKMNAKSKNEAAAREEVKSKLDALKSGKMPVEYREITTKKREYTAKQSFIEDKRLEDEYKNRSHVSKATL